MKNSKRAFTLIELVIAVLIIGILAAVAVPMYQKAVLKSRYSTLMPLAKAIADSNETYYLGHGTYAQSPASLPVQGQAEANTEGTQIDMGNGDYSYVLAKRDNLPMNYIVYQKYSVQFPEEIHCEVDANDTQAQEVCKSFGATKEIGEILTPGYVTYVLSGTGNGVGRCPQGATCDANGQITACPDGQTLNNGACGACDIENATACSTTAYEATSCNTGYIPKNGVCEKEGTTYGWNGACQEWNVNWGGSGCSDNNTFTSNSECWSSGSDYPGCNNNLFTDQSLCKGSGESCQNNIFEGQSKCTGSTLGACSNNTFYTGSTCDTLRGNAGASCQHNTFDGGTCQVRYGQGAQDGCSFNTFSNKASCRAQDNKNGGIICAGNTYTNNSRCYSNPDYGTAATGTCGTAADGTPSTYDATSCCVGSYCPAGTSCAEKGLPNNPPA